MKLLSIFLAAVILLAGVLTLNACQTLNSPIENYTWILTSRTEWGKNIVPLEGTEITVFFDSQKKQFHGSGGCNQYSGDYTVNGLSITITGLITTLMSCGEQRDEQEKQYLATFQSAESFRMEHGNLVIYCGKQILNYKRGNSTQTPTQWGE